MIFKMKDILIKISIVLAFSSCYTQRVLETPGMMEPYINHSISEVISTWGPYQEITEDGKGGKVYTWINSIQRPAYYLNGIYQPPQVISCRRSFYVNQNGTVYNYFYTGRCR